jgi:DNA-binding transcriptional regulator YdaS (Cro superfamily)
MTELLQQAIDAARQLSPERQDYIARAILALADDRGPQEIDPEDLPAVLEGFAQAERGEFASDETVEALFRRLRE